MDLVSSWSTLICLSCISCVIVELIIPHGKMEKMLNMVLGVFILSCLLLPLSKTGFKWKLKANFSPQSEIKATDFPEYTDKQFEDFASANLKAIIKNLLNNMKINPEKIQIFMDRSKDTCISIIKCKIYIKKSDEREIALIKNEVQQKLNIEAEVIPE